MKIHPAVLLFVLTTACGMPPAEEPATTSSQRSQLVVDNGRELNGRELNGRELNGRELNGRELNGRELNGRELNGRELNGRELNGRELNGNTLNGAQANGTAIATVWTEASELVGSAPGGGTVRGAGLVGAVLESDDGLVRYRIDAAAPIAGVWHYNLSLAIDTAWVALCGTDATGAETPVIPLVGSWDFRSGVPGGGAHLDDPGKITFACHGFALAKCVEFGFPPWGFAGTASLASAHQACTRMLRADFCGDGSTATKDGTLINVYDRYGIQLDTETWPLEAEWDADGARCVTDNHRRGTGEAPSCLKDLKSDTCGALTHFQSGALLMSEYARKPGLPPEPADDD